MASSDLVAKWDVTLSDKVHRVEFEHGTTTGKRVIRVDGVVCDLVKNSTAIHYWHLHLWFCYDCSHCAPYRYLCYLPPLKEEVYAIARDVCLSV